MRVVRVFLSTPSDVDLERAQVQQLVRDVNETLQFLDPDRELRLEVVHHETHAFPDVGAPQQVIDRQIPVDYDIYLGIMWKRAGTRTGDAPSGTIHEFDAALAHATDHGWPIVMFFFCEEQIAIPHDEDELDQLGRVLAFRQRLNAVGYTASYDSRDDFREALRPRLLRAIADVLTSDQRADSARADMHGPQVPPAQESRLRTLAHDYENVRATMSSSPQRTNEMERIFNAMLELAADVRPLATSLEQSTSPGERLAAIAILRAFPSADHLAWLAERLDNPTVEANFVGYQAAVALSQAVRSLPATQRDALAVAVDRALELANHLPRDTDRIRVLERARGELNRLTRQAPR